MDKTGSMVAISSIEPRAWCGLRPPLLPGPEGRVEGIFTDHRVQLPSWHIWETEAKEARRCVDGQDCHWRQSWGYTPLPGLLQAEGKSSRRKEGRGTGGRGTGRHTCPRGGEQVLSFPQRGRRRHPPTCLTHSGSSPKPHKRPLSSAPRGSRLHRWSVNEMRPQHPNGLEGVCVHCQTSNFFMAGIL